jgi:hypothetical protein
VKDAQKPEARQKVRPTNVSLYPPQRAALEALARREGHDQLARVVQRLIVKEAIHVFGGNWAEIVTAEQGQEAA